MARIIQRGGYQCQLLVTGQTTQYSSKEDDGYHEKGVSKKYQILTTGQYSGTTTITLNSKTHDLSNNCVKDKRTGKMWARYVPVSEAAAGIGPDGDGKLLWLDDTNNEDIFDFRDQANTKKLGGHTDWRVPDYNELISLLKHEGAYPLIDDDAFPSTVSDIYWTDTTRPDATTYANGVSFKYGSAGAYEKATSKHYCRLVRG